MSDSIYDIIVIGGGINGTGIAADAAGRGLSVLLCEQNDFAGATSSASSKLIHGGLRYLEQYQFRLVREALNEREILLKKAPHLVKPLQFILPLNKAIHSEWLIHAGLFLYDHLARHYVLPKTETIQLQHHLAGKHIKKQFQKGFSYFDCFADDSRLVMANALAAKQKNAHLFNYTECVAARRIRDYWEVELQGFKSTRKTVRGKILINATGPWVENFLDRIGLPSKNKITLVKGSHIVVSKFYQGDFAYILPLFDGRFVFVIPYLQQFCLIGTTDIFFTSNDPSYPIISSDEIRYLCDAVNTYFTVQITPNEILYSFAGVRPLKKDNQRNAAKISRDYTLEIQDENGQLPIVSILGGKITTYRKLAESTLHQLKNYLPHITPDWTKNSFLPGGDFSDFKQYMQLQQQRYPWLPNELLVRYIHQYGTGMDEFLIQTHRLEQLGKHYGEGLYQLEVNYLIQKEWACNAEDILWRRTKLGYFYSPTQHLELQNDINQFIN